MFDWEADGRHFSIRRAETEAEFHAAEEIQREVWGFSDLDIVPMATLVAAQWAGGMLLCSYEGEKIIGFAFGFPANESGIVSIHSHMLAVLPEFRNLNVGFFLKLAQRRYALEKPVDEITWTFDPLQSLNAHFNFVKLGVISTRYIENFYGEASSSPLHKGFGTDRLWVRWRLSSERVTTRILPREDRRTEASSIEIPSTLNPDAAAVRRVDDLPVLGNLNEHLAGSEFFVEIPHDVNALKTRNPAAGVAWRQATRTVFRQAVDAGFTVSDFVRISDGIAPRWFYRLSR